MTLTRNMYNRRGNLTSPFSISVMILVAVLAIQLSSVIAPNVNTAAYNVYAKYSNNQEQTQSLYNDCRAGDLSGAPNCANNGLQTQTDGGISTLTNSQISGTDITDRSIGDRNIGQQNTGDTSADSSADLGGDDAGVDTGDSNADGGSFIGGDQTIDVGDSNNNENSGQGIASTDGALEDQPQVAGENQGELDQGINSDSNNMEDPFVLPFG